MIKCNHYNLTIILLIISIFYGCSKLQESAGVTRKSPDEFQVFEALPLVIPPNFNLVSPDQIPRKDISNIEKALAEEILFGLKDKDVTELNQLSTMDQILSKTNAMNASNTIRDELDENFASEMNTKNIFIGSWETEKEIFDVVKESEKIRAKTISKESIVEDEVSIEKEKIKKKKKKKKRFFFF